jgi:hypothetical protein
MLAFVDPRDGRHVVMQAPIEGFWTSVDGSIACEFCSKRMEGRAMFQPPIGMICEACVGEVFGDVT